jgi:hypothetical protein
LPTAEQREILGERFSHQKSVTLVSIQRTSSRISNRIFSCPRTLDVRWQPLLAGQQSAHLAEFDRGAAMQFGGFEMIMTWSDAASVVASNHEWKGRFSMLPRLIG